MMRALGKPFDPPRRSERRRLPEDGLARFLGYFSFGLGVSQIAAPGIVNRVVGAHDDRSTRACQRMVGARELAAAAGIFSERRPARWLWFRVAGDVCDLALLARSLSTASGRVRLVAAIGSVAGISGVDLLAARRNARAERARTFAAAITVRASREETYRVWHDLANLPRFMAHVESVEVMDGRSHWRATAPAGRTIEWDAEIVEDRPGELIAWRSLPGAAVPHSGRLAFAPAPGDRGTEIRVEMRYEPPAGEVGANLAKLLGEEPSLQAKDELRRFKQVVETGRVVRSDGSPEGPLTRRMLKQRPAQPLPQGARAA